MGPKTFKRIVDFMFPIRKEYNHAKITASSKYWDYPNYGGLPKKISNQLSSEAVDAMQITLSFGFKRKYQFANFYRQELRGLGEPGNF